MNIISESHKGNCGPCGYETTVWRDKSREKGGAVVLLRGGLGDTHSMSLRPLARALIEESNGELIVGTTGTNRAVDPIRAVTGYRRARLDRSLSMYKASKYVTEKYKPNLFVAGGQSEGGVTAVDTVMHWNTDAKNPGVKPGTALFTINAPGVFEAMPVDRSKVVGLIRLGANCMEDVSQMGVAEARSIFAPQIRHGVSVWEPMYLAGEVDYLSKGIDLSRDIESLRRIGVTVNHVFHYGDMVPGAEFESPHSAVFEGAHVRVMREPEPVARYMVETTMGLLDALPPKAAA